MIFNLQARYFYLLLKTNTMKKLLLLSIIAATSIMASAQQTTKVVKDETKVKKTSSVPQKVHNTFSKKKEYNGKKTKQVKTVEKTTK